MASTLHAHLVSLTNHRRVCASLGGGLREFTGETVTSTRSYTTHRARDIDVDQQAQRHLLAPAAAAMPNTASEIPVGQALQVTVPLRRLVRRRTPDHHRARHRTTEPARSTSKRPASPATQNRVGFAPRLNGPASTEEDQANSHAHLDVLPAIRVGGDLPLNVDAEKDRQDELRHCAMVAGALPRRAARL